LLHTQLPFCNSTSISPRTDSFDLKAKSIHHELYFPEIEFKMYFIEKLNTNSEIPPVTINSGLVPTNPKGGWLRIEG